MKKTDEQVSSNTTPAAATMVPQPRWASTCRRMWRSEMRQKVQRALERSEAFSEAQRLEKSKQLGSCKLEGGDHPLFGRRGCVGMKCHTTGTQHGLYRCDVPVHRQAPLCRHPSIQTLHQPAAVRHSQVQQGAARTVEDPVGQGGQVVFE